MNSYSVHWVITITQVSLRPLFQSTKKLSEIVNKQNSLPNFFDSVTDLKKIFQRPELIFFNHKFSSRLKVVFLHILFFFNVNFKAFSDFWLQFRFFNHFLSLFWRTCFKLLQKLIKLGFFLTLKLFLTQWHRPLKILKLSISPRRLQLLNTLRSFLLGRSLK